ncbi:hypothetical protein M408DRAFT_11350 [Serendipita vermifera MAFF 305830]|uniref:Thioesterase domain-containing protein n=1 Tax=Serendipita vermifera MAFF 305830 TaxID=933852 RepID=A0A0C3AGJ0_SERVB|nr:hypothetical protein M408DRAFT_11350 [Serendipita vermifera MAFF 305830]
MAPFARNMAEIRLKSEGIANNAHSESNQADGSSIYIMEGRIDPDWMVAVVPHGGYLIALIVQACNLVQATTKQAEVLYLSTQFIGPSTPGPCTITIQRIKSGKNYSNLVANLSQAGKDNIHCQLIYGTLNVAKHPFGPFPASSNYLTLAHPSAMSRRCPLVTHPSKCTISPFKHRPYTFAKHLAQAIDPYYATTLESQTHGHASTNPMDLGGGGSVWGAWFQMKNEEDISSTPLAAFLADVSPEFIPKGSKQSPVWLPTLGLTMDFKHRTPSQAPGIAPRTFGVFLTSKFLIEGRHDLTCEVWTAPCEIGEGTEQVGWQDRMFCIASSTQTWEVANRDGYLQFISCFRRDMAPFSNSLAIIKQQRNNTLKIINDIELNPLLNHSIYCSTDVSLVI